MCVDNFMCLWVRAFSCRGYVLFLFGGVNLNNSADLGGSSAYLDEITKCINGEGFRC